MEVVPELNCCRSPSYISAMICTVPTLTVVTLFNKTITFSLWTANLPIARGKC